MSTKESPIALLSEALILELTSRLVAIPTRNPPGEEKPGAEFILETLRGWGIEAELVLEPDPNRPQVVAWVRGTGGGQTLILNGHIDTVREGDIEAWRSPPFSATRRGNQLYGLGAADMKGGLAVGMVVLKALNESGARLPGTLMFQAVMGEELAEAGTRTLLKLGYTGDHAIVLEPTELKIDRATRGVAWYKIALTGDSTHCGRAGPGSVDVMAQFTRFGAALSDYHKEIAAQVHPLLPSPAARITRVRAGNRHNHLATQCEFIVDRRMLPHETFDRVRDDLVAILGTLKAGEPALDYRIELDRGNEPSVTAAESPIIEVLRRNSREIRGVDPQVVGKVAGTDMRNFVLDAGIPAVNFGPGSFETSNCHAPNEFVPVDDLMGCARVVMGTAYDVLG